MGDGIAFDCAVENRFSLGYVFDYLCFFSFGGVAVVALMFAHPRKAKPGFLIALVTAQTQRYGFSNNILVILQLHVLFQVSDEDGAGRIHIYTISLKCRKHSSGGDDATRLTFKKAIGI